MPGPHERLAAAISDRCTITREVGAGGMATVFLAREIKHDRDVALKVLRPERAAAMGSDRFPREIRTVAQFNHPHILSLYDSGETQGFLYYVMPFVEGETLRDSRTAVFTRRTVVQRLVVADLSAILRSRP